MNYMSYTLLSIALSLLLSGCNATEDTTDTPDSTPDNTLTCKEKLSNLELDIHKDLDTIKSDSDFTFLLKAKDGKTFSHSRGISTAQSMYESASTSKMVTAVVILDLVDKGILSLDDTPNKYINAWPQSGNFSNITLKELLSFTSGLSEAPLCNFVGGYDFEKCVIKIISKNPDAPLSSTEFHYGPNHLQVAGLMAIKASNSKDWTELFNTFKKENNLFADSVYDLPSSSNPKLAGGMHWSADEYLEFLEKLYTQKILSPTLIAQMSSDQSGDALMVSSPAKDSINQDWHYGFGMWIESDSNPFDKSKVTGRVSSPGLYGAYPFIDYTHEYYGILARQGGFNTFEKGYEIFSSVDDKLEEWAQSSCQ